MLETKTFSISELAREFDISPRTIRFYEEKRLISPQRTKGNQRIYSRRDRARLKLILRGKRFGYSLDEIAEMIGMTDVDMNEVAQIEKSLVYGEKKLREIRNRIEDLHLLELDLLNVKAKLVQRLADLREEDRDFGDSDSQQLDIRTHSNR
jgi:DNA-binding transcriptional MerR regulator